MLVRNRCRSTRAERRSRAGIAPVQPDPSAAWSEEYARLGHVLFTVRRDAIGAVDAALAERSDPSRRRDRPALPGPAADACGHGSRRRNARPPGGPALRHAAGHLSHPAAARFMARRHDLEPAGPERPGQRVVQGVGRAGGHRLGNTCLGSAAPRNEARWRSRRAGTRLSDHGCSPRPECASSRFVASSRSFRTPTTERRRGGLLPFVRPLGHAI